MNSFVILPNQLFTTKSAIDQMLLCDTIYLMEEPFFFSLDKPRYMLVFMRASMRNYYELLRRIVSGMGSRAPAITYVTVDNILSSGNNFLDYLVGHKRQVNMFYPHAWEGGKLSKIKFNGLPIKFYESEAFLLDKKSASKAKLSPNRPIMSFYIAMRKKYMAPLNVPVGGKWLHAQAKKTVNPQIKYSALSDSARTYVRGVISQMAPMKNVDTSTKPAIVDKRDIRLPVSHDEAMLVMDAVVGSGFSTSENVYNVIDICLDHGLLTPRTVCDIALKHRTPVAGVENFLYRICLREFSRVLVDQRLVSRRTLSRSDANPIEIGKHKCIVDAWRKK